MNVKLYVLTAMNRCSILLLHFLFPIQLEKIRIGHDGRGLGTGWYLEEVVIIIHDECWIFPCNRWLADYEDDGKTERDLFAGAVFYILIKDIRTSKGHQDTRNARTPGHQNIIHVNNEMKHLGI